MLQTIINAFKNKTSSPLLLYTQVKETLALPKYAPYIHQTFDCFAEKLALQSDARYKKNAPLSPLDGIPFCVSNHFSLTSFSPTCSSDILKGYVCPYTSSVLQTLINLGAIPCCYTKTNEFSCILNEQDVLSSHALNANTAPYLVKENVFPFALCSDVEGDTTLCAMHLSLPAFKVSQGALSRYGLMSPAPFMDTVCLVAQNVSDIDSVLSLIHTKDEKDVHALSLLHDTQKQSFALSSPLFFEHEKCTVSLFSYPYFDHLFTAYQLLSCVQTSSTLSCIDGIRYGASFDTLSPLLQNKMQDGKDILIKEDLKILYQKACNLKAHVLCFFETLTKSNDFVLFPLYTENKINKNAVILSSLLGFPALYTSSCVCLSKKGNDHALLRFSKTLKEGR